MRKYVLICTMLGASICTNAQFGLTVATTLNASPDWQVAVENFVTHRHMNFLRNGTMAMVDFTLPSSSLRWRFQPAIQGMRATAYYYPHYFEAYSVGFQYNVSYAPFGMGKKNSSPMIFCTLSPGLSMVAMQYDEPVIEGGGFNGNYRYHSDEQVAFHIGTSISSEFKLSSMITISPMAGFRFFPNIDWTNLTFLLTEGDMTGTYDRTTWRQYFLALRFGLDLKKTQRQE